MNSKLLNMGKLLIILITWLYLSLEVPILLLISLIFWWVVSLDEHEEELSNVLRDPTDELYVWLDESSGNRGPN